MTSRRPLSVDDLEDGVQVAVAAVHVEDAGAAGAVERLDDHLAAELVEEVLQARDVARDEALAGSRRGS